MSAKRRAEVATEVARDVKPDDVDAGALLRRWAHARAASSTSTKAKSTSAATVLPFPTARARERRSVRRAVPDGGGDDGDGPSREASRDVQVVWDLPADDSPEMAGFVLETVEFLGRKWAAKFGLAVSPENDETLGNKRPRKRRQPQPGSDPRHGVTHDEG